MILNLYLSENKPRLFIVLQLLLCLVNGGNCFYQGIGRYGDAVNLLLNEELREVREI